MLSWRELRVGAHEGSGNKAKELAAEEAGYKLCIEKLYKTQRHFSRSDTATFSTAFILLA